MHCFTPTSAASFLSNPAITFNLKTLIWSLHFMLRWEQNAKCSKTFLHFGSESKRKTGNIKPDAPDSVELEVISLPSST